MFVPCFIFSALFKCCLVLGEHLKWISWLNWERRKETSGVANFRQHLCKRASENQNDPDPSYGLRDLHCFLSRLCCSHESGRKFSPVRTAIFWLPRGWEICTKCLGSRNSELQCKVAGFKGVRKPAAKADCNKYDVTLATEGWVVSDRKWFQVVEQLLSAF